MPPLANLDLAQVRAALAALGVDGWLVFDFHGANPVAPQVLGIRGMATRRLFVLLPRDGAPVAVAHRIELQPFAGFPGEVRPYSAWSELHARLRELVAGKRLAMEVSPNDAVPYLDRVPHGVVQLLESALATIAQEALAWAGAELSRGSEVREVAVQQRVVAAIARAGLVTDHPPIVGFQENAANPHYEPRAGSDRRLAVGDVLLLDLWAGPAKGSVFADQTWMAFAGRTPPPEVVKVWTTVRDARDAAVARLREAWSAGRAVTGADLDDAARGVISQAGYGEYFLHRTGHSIDRDLHGSGPHLDNFETRDTRTLLAGIGFSVEPGVYLPGRFGVRSEINVFLGETGPAVTPGHPQRDLQLV